MCSYPGSNRRSRDPEAAGRLGRGSRIALARVKGERLQSRVMNVPAPERYLWRVVALTILVAGVTAAQAQSGRRPPTNSGGAVVTNSDGTQEPEVELRTQEVLL